MKLRNIQLKAAREGYDRFQQWLTRQLPEEFWRKSAAEKFAGICEVAWAWRPVVIRNRLKLALTRGRPR